MPRVCIHGCTPGLGSRPLLCPRLLLKDSTVCLGFLSPLSPPQDKPSTDSTIKNTILCSSVAPGDRHPDAERPLASWPDGRALPPTHTDRPRKEGVCYKTRALSFPADMRSFAHGAAGGADADSGQFLCSSSKRPHAPVLTAAYCAH